MIFLSSLILAQEYKMEISAIPEDKIFGPEETVQIKITLYDLNNNLINDEVSIIFEDIKRTKVKEATILSNKFEKIELTNEAISGEGKIIARYKDSEITESFFMKENELAKFEITDEILKITNIGNTKYRREVYITIGKTTGVKNPEIDIGKFATYRLVAPEGIYNIKISDGVSQSLEIGEIRLTGTGKAIGALDEQVSKRSPLTGGISPDENSEQAYLIILKTANSLMFLF
jgi:hypothetical protein